MSKLIFAILFILCFAIFPEEPPIPSVINIPGWNIVYGDYAIPENATPGEVLSIIPGRKQPVLGRSVTPYDPNIIGVAVLDSLDSLRVAVGGEVEVLIDGSVDSVNAGEWLVASGAIGKAMPLEEDYPLTPIVIGIALENFVHGGDKDRIRILLTPGERLSSPKSKSGE